MTNEHLAGLFVSADHVIVASCCMPVLGTEQVRLLQPVCTTEIGRLALKYKDLEKKGVKLATLSADPVSYSELPCRTPQVLSRCTE